MKEVRMTLLVLILLSFPFTLGYLINRVLTHTEKTNEAELSSHTITQGWDCFWVYGTRLPEEGEQLRMLVSAPRQYDKKEWAIVSRKAGVVSVQTLD